MALDKGDWVGVIFFIAIALLMVIGIVFLAKEYRDSKKLDALVKVCDMDNAQFFDMCSELEDNVGYCLDKNRLRKDYCKTIAGIY